LAVLNRAAALTGGSTLELISDCNPWQLYDLLQQRGYTLTMVKTADGGYTGMIRPRDGQIGH
jgi:uncharacterized protein (DUF2249 family)